MELLNTRSSLIAVCREWTRTSDLSRVHFEVTLPKPFSHLAFPRFIDLKRTRKMPSFDGELMARFRIVPNPSLSGLLLEGKTAEYNNRITGLMGSGDVYG